MLLGPLPKNVMAVSILLRNFQQKLCFLDLVIAFGRVPRKAIWKAPRKRQIYEELIRGVQSLCVRINNMKSAFTVVLDDSKREGRIKKFH